MTFLLDEPDIEHLVETIWDGRSILSGETDRWALSLCKWDKRESWSPWNCILLTTEESKRHRLMKIDYTAIYGSSFVDRVRAKHQQGLKKFGYLQQTVDDLNEIPELNRNYSKPLDYEPVEMNL